MNIRITKTIDFQEYKKIKNTPKEERFEETFEKYWDEICAPLYEQEALNIKELGGTPILSWRIIDLYLMRDIIEEAIEKFDFESVENHMKQKNWSWGSNIPYRINGK